MDDIEYDMMQRRRTNSPFSDPYHTIIEPNRTKEPIKEYWENEQAQGRATRPDAAASPVVPAVGK